MCNDNNKKLSLTQQLANWGQFLTGLAACAAIIIGFLKSSDIADKISEFKISVDSMETTVNKMQNKVTRLEDKIDGFVGKKHSNLKTKKQKIEYWTKTLKEANILLATNIKPLNFDKAKLALELSKESKPENQAKTIERYLNENISGHDGIKIRVNPAHNDGFRITSE